MAVAPQQKPIASSLLKQATSPEWLKSRQNAVDKNDIEKALKMI